MPKKKRIKIKPQGLAKPLEIDVEIDEEKEEPKKKKRKRGISVPCDRDWETVAPNYSFS